MFTPDRAILAALGFLVCAATPLAAAESIGKAVHIKTVVTGASGDLSVNDAVYQDERIRTSKSGLGQFVFRDGTKLAVGWGSSVVIDNFVFDGSRTVKKLTVKAAKGTFRWVSGNSKHAAYEILTPAGTIGVRGTAFDFYVGADGTTAVVLLNGAATFCGAGGCRQLTRRCDCVVARPNGRLTDTRRVDRGIFKTLGNSRALPFLSGNQTLAATAGAGGCGLASAAEIPRDDITPRDIRKARPTPSKPGKEDKPDEEKPRPEPDKHHHHHHDDHHGHHGHHDKPDGHGKHDRPHGDRDKHDRPHGHRGDHGHRDGQDRGKSDRG
ncbi:FecR family protein [Rhizobium herbae]|uniref:FecR protein domain-containing protein n=1 Tax=Rhizobium herbae TaxID=508661 RepID=A0ABS4EHI7_9HYPH|nr:FecR domain-containing protein [Rhizobium herbae]MBP1857405.1 hypothetical protein [Rhizobium herbae]